jgi:hypothetical protein
MATTFSSNYVASATVFGATSLDSLAASATWLAGRSSALIDNTTTKYVDAYLTGKFKAVTGSPTAGVIQVWVGSLLDDTPTYPDTYAGADAAMTWTNADIRNSGAKQAVSIATGTGSGVVYPFAPVSIASLFQGIMPKKWWAWVTHSMVTTLNATANAGGQLYYVGVNYGTTP